MTARPGAWLRIISVATALVLGLQILASATLHATTWPFSAFTMFSEPRDEAVVIELVRHGADGTARLNAEDLGFAGRNQLDSYIRRNIVTFENRRAIVRPNSTSAAQTVLALYNDRHDTSISRLDVVVKITPIPQSDAKPTERHLVLSISR